MKKLGYLSLTLALLATRLELSAQAIDGTLVGDESFYGPALSIQNTDTEFGNANFKIDAINSGGGSEIDQVFGTVDDGQLYLLITGNLEPNFNKLVIFFDSVAGGSNTLDGPNLPSAFDGFCGRCGGGLPIMREPDAEPDGGLQNMDGLTFDAGFAADYVVSLTHGNENVRDATAAVNFWAMSAHYADLTQGGSVAPVAAGIVLAPQGMPNVLRQEGDGFDDPPATPDGFDADGVDSTIFGPQLPNLAPGQLIDREYALSHGGCLDDSGAGCLVPELEFVLDVDPAEIDTTTPSNSNGSDHRNFRNTVGLRAAIDNSNNFGVDGFIAGFPDTLGDPETVETGVELAIPLAALGNPTGDIRVTAFVNGSDYDFASNQFSGVGVLQGNLGSDGTSGFFSDQLGFNLADIAGDQFVTIEYSNPVTPGDLNGDGSVNFGDLQGFVTALTTPDEFASQFPNGNLDACDVSGDSECNFGDLQPFVELLTGGGAGATTLAVPEPTSLLLLLAGTMAGNLVARRRKY